MRKILFLFLWVISSSLYAQRVGLVLSGGAAKGIAHVGVLRALEENEIPIDYVVGTSMGGIIAGCYAAGYSPEQIEAIVLSNEFLRWINGQPESGYNTYYYLPDENPGFITLSLSLDSTLNPQINSSLANDVSLNFALAEKMAQAEAISKRNFDSLFVPLRVMAADVFTQTQVVLGKGSLSNSLRATQTVPFFYAPIRVEGKYLFDGGVYNNFPVDVLQSEFAPDVIIGSNVSSKVFGEYPFDRDDQLLNSSMLFVFLDKSDPGQIPENGVYLQPNLTGYTTIDFDRARSLIDSGYVQTLRQMDDIKAKVKRRISCEDVAVKRNKFTNQQYPFTFDEIKLHGFNSKQRIYLKRMFGVNRKQQDLSFGDVKENYFDLVSEKYFSNIYPNISFNQNSRKFALELTRRQQKNFQVDFGGVIATRDISNIFIGLNFYRFDKQLLHGYLAFHSGNFYRSIVASTRWDYPSLSRFYIEPEFVFNSWNFTENTDLLKEAKSTILRRIDRSLSFKIGWPVNNKYKMYLQAGAISNKDNYINESAFTSTSTLDELKTEGFKGGITISSNNLNRKQYASSGRAYSFTANYFDVLERYQAGNTSVKWLQGKTPSVDHRWLSAKLRIEQYFNKGRFKPGFLVEAAYSSQPFFTNYQGTLINAPSFNPLPESRTLLLERFRAFSYVAGGGRIVVSMAPKLDWRFEGYMFKPFESLQPGINQSTSVSTELIKASFLGMSGVVFHSPIGPVSLMVNYYDDQENEFGVLLHVGFLLFNKPSLE
jgi:NTE family protein